MKNQRLMYVTLVVNEYDEAIRFYTEKLSFEIVEDRTLSESKRWVLISPPRSRECCILLAKAVNEEQKSRIGNQTGGRVFLFLQTNDFKMDYQNLLDHNVSIIREPKIEEWGTVAVFADLYGNLWDLIENKKQEY
jgi:uncharacterized glyoxalase superfamily protein PhnB